MENKILNIDDYLLKVGGKELVKSFNDDLSHHIISLNRGFTKSLTKPFSGTIRIEDILYNGLTSIGGVGKAPHHIESFTNQMMTLLNIACDSYSKIISVPEIIVYLDYFLRVDYGEDYYNRMDSVVDYKYQTAVTLLIKIKKIFTQIFYNFNQKSDKRKNGILFNIIYFDKYYFNHVFGNFKFPDGSESNWKSVSKLQQLVMLWLNEKENKDMLFPTQIINMYVEKGEYADKETADFLSEMWSNKARITCYQSSNIQSVSEYGSTINNNIFSYSLLPSGYIGGSKSIISLNINNIIQQWSASKEKSLIEYITDITIKTQYYLTAINNMLYDLTLNNNLYINHFLDLDNQFLTIGVVGLTEAAKALGIIIDINNIEFINFFKEVLGTINNINKENSKDKTYFNLEITCSNKLSDSFSKIDNFNKNLTVEGIYSLYVYDMKNTEINSIDRFYYQGANCSTYCSGGALLCNDIHNYLSKPQYRKMMDVAIFAGCNLFTYDIPISQCTNCNFKSDHLIKKCPNCKVENIIYNSSFEKYLNTIDDFNVLLKKEDKFYV